ncbi:Gx transporter family protein [Ruminiclostridium hungatei]|nr:Gx transporter family protein [Ruminiclostridium hungatei]
MKTRRLSRMALLTSVALIIFSVEAQLPPVIPVPGVKLGLANIITIYAIFCFGASDALIILLCRIFLGSIFGGQLMTLLYSLGGGILCFLTVFLLYRLLTLKEVWISSAAGAISHNMGQLIVAAAVMKTTAIFWYLPVLLISGILSGTFTGLCAQFLIGRMDKLRLSRWKGGEIKQAYVLKNPRERELSRKDNYKIAEGRKGRER